MKAFDALYAERYFIRAGQRVGLSQSAMSGALTRFREVFDDSVPFQRFEALNDLNPVV